MHTSHFLPEVCGSHLRIYTDHLPLKQAFDSNNIPLNDSQAYRQITEIGRFTRDIEHVSGVDNTFADYLSRIEESKKGDAYREDPETPPFPMEMASAESVRVKLVL